MVAYALTPSAQLTRTSYEGVVRKHGDGRICLTTSTGYPFEFFLWRDRNIRTYVCFILRQPGYARRPDGFEETHRAPTANGGFEICFRAHSAPKTLPHAIALVEIWAELTSRYIRTGERFD